MIICRVGICGNLTNTTTRLINELENSTATWIIEDYPEPINFNDFIKQEPCRKGDYYPKPPYEIEQFKVPSPIILKSFYWRRNGPSRSGWTFKKRK